MKLNIRKFTSYAVCISSTASENITALTKGIRFTANTVSKSMDTMNGGVLKHGGFHRLYGGHSIADFAMWKSHGFEFAKELSKDSLTSNGIPIPGVQTAVTKNFISVKAAQKFGSLNIGDFLASGLAAVDTGINFYHFVRNRDQSAVHPKRILIKGSIKIATASVHGNIPLMTLGFCDLVMFGYIKLENQVQFSFDLNFTANA